MSFTNHMLFEAQKYSSEAQRFNNCMGEELCCCETCGGRGIGRENLLEDNDMLSHIAKKFGLGEYECRKLKTLLLGNDSHELTSYERRFMKHFKPAIVDDKIVECPECSAC